MSTGAARRLRVPAALVVAGLLAAALSWSLPARDAPTPSVGTLPPMGEVEVLTAVATTCRWLRVDLPELVATDAPADRVLAELQDVRLLAEGAARADVTWVRLASGVEALEASLHDDDGPAAGLALAVLDDVCAVGGTP